MNISNSKHNSNELFGFWLKQMVSEIFLIKTTNKNIQVVLYKGLNQFSTQKENNEREDSYCC